MATVLPLFARSLSIGEMFYMAFPQCVGLTLPFVLIVGILVGRLRGKTAPSMSEAGWSGFYAGLWPGVILVFAVVVCPTIGGTYADEGIEIVLLLVGFAAIQLVCGGGAGAIAARLKFEADHRDSFPAPESEE